MSKYFIDLQNKTTNIFKTSFFWSELSSCIWRCNSRFPLQSALKSAGFPLQSGLRDELF